MTFANFHKCDDTAIMDLRSQGDLFHPTKMEKITFVNTDKSTSSFLTLNNPILGFINSADCVDMPCDARKKVLITDMDGSVLGKVIFLIIFLIHISSILEIRNKECNSQAGD